VFFGYISMNSGLIRPFDKGKIHWNNPKFWCFLVNYRLLMSFCPLEPRKMLAFCPLKAEKHCFGLIESQEASFSRLQGLMVKKSIYALFLTQEVQRKRPKNLEKPKYPENTRKLTRFDDLRMGIREMMTDWARNGRFGPFPTHFRAPRPPRNPENGRKNQENGRKN